MENLSIFTLLALAIIRPTVQVPCPGVSFNVNHFRKCSESSSDLISMGDDSFKMVFSTMSCSLFVDGCIKVQKTINRLEATYTFYTAKQTIKGNPINVCNAWEQPTTFVRSIANATEFTQKCPLEPGLTCLKKKYIDITKIRGFDRVAPAGLDPVGNVTFRFDLIADSGSACFEFAYNLKLPWIFGQ